VNLAVADITFAIFLAPKFILSRTFTHPDGEAGKALCRLLTGGTLGWFGGVSSAFTLVAVAVERFYAVMHPHGNKGRLTKRKLKVTYDARGCTFFHLTHSLNPPSCLNCYFFIVYAAGKQRNETGR